MEPAELEQKTDQVSNQPLVTPETPVEAVSPRRFWKQKNFRIAVGISVVLLISLGTFGYFWEEREQPERREQELAGEPSAEEPASGKPSEAGREIEEKGWFEWKDPHGFTVQIPEGWQIRVDESGLVRVGKDVGSKKGAAAFLQTLLFPEPKTSEEVLKLVLSELEKTFPNFEVTSRRTLESYQSLICQIRYSASEHVGAMLISVNGQNAFLSGLASEKEKFGQSRPALLKILSSFRYDSALQDPSKVSGALQMVPWEDPNEGAFTMSVPQGWNISGGLVRPYIDAGVKLQVTSGEKGIQVENPYPPMYTTPNWALEMAGFTEGSRYNPTGGLAQDMIVMGEKSAESYIRDILGGTLGLAVEKVTTRAGLAGKVPELPWTTQTTAAEAALSGDGKVHKAVVVEQGLEMSGVGMWLVSLVHYWAPEEEIALVEEIVEVMSNSFTLDSAWAKREQAEVAKRAGIISATGSEIADIINSTFEYQSKVQDRAARQWSNAMLGVERVYNPKTGEEYEVPHGAEKYWSDGYSIVGTKVSEPPTYLDDWTELIPVE